MSECYHCKSETTDLEIIVQDENNTSFDICKRCSKFFATLKRVMDDPENQKIMERLGEDNTMFENQVDFE